MNRQLDSLDLLLQILNATQTLLSRESGQGPDWGKLNPSVRGPCAHAAAGRAACHTPARCQLRCDHGCSDNGSVLIKASGQKQILSQDCKSSAGTHDISTFGGRKKSSRWQKFITVPRRQPQGPCSSWSATGRCRMSWCRCICSFRAPVSIWRVLLWRSKVLLNRQVL